MIQDSFLFKERLFSAVFSASPSLFVSLDYCNDQNQNSNGIQTDQNVKRRGEGACGETIAAVRFRCYNSGWIFFRRRGNRRGGTVSGGAAFYRNLCGSDRVAVVKILAGKRVPVGSPLPGCGGGAFLFGVLLERDGCGKRIIFCFFLDIVG